MRPDTKMAICLSHLEGRGRGQVQEDTAKPSEQKDQPGSQQQRCSGNEGMTSGLLPHHPYLLALAYPPGSPTLLFQHCKKVLSHILAIVWGTSLDRGRSP